MLNNIRRKTRTSLQDNNIQTQRRDEKTTGCRCTHTHMIRLCGKRSIQILLKRKCICVCDTKEALFHYCFEIKISKFLVRNTWPPHNYTHSLTHSLQGKREMNERITNKVNVCE